MVGIGNWEAEARSLSVASPPRSAMVSSRSMARSTDCTAGPVATGTPLDSGWAGGTVTRGPPPGIIPDDGIRMPSSMQFGDADVVHVDAFGRQPCDTEYQGIDVAQ